MKDKNFIIFRAQKLHPSARAKNSIYKSIRHLEKHDSVADISHPERSFLNKTQIHKTLAEKGLKKAIKGIIDRHNRLAPKKLRNDASVGAELLFSYSSADKMTNEKSLQEFEKIMCDFVKKELPGFKILRIDRHCDESSIHWHLVGFCINEKGLISTREVLGGPERMRELQTSLGEYFKPLGLERGIPKRTTKKKHSTKREFTRAQQLEEYKKITQEVFER